MIRGKPVEATKPGTEIVDRGLWISIALVLAYSCMLVWSITGQLKARSSLSSAVLYTSAPHDPASVRIVQSFGYMRMKVSEVQKPGQLSLTLSHGKLMGYTAISGYLVETIGRTKKLAGAAYMSAICLLFVLLRGSPIGKAFHLLSVVSPILVAVLSVPVVSGCEGCTLLADPLSLFAKWGLVVLPFLLGAILWFGRGQIARYLAGFFCVTVLLTQSLLLLHEPKFCIFCLSISITVISCLYSAVHNEFKPLTTGSKGSLYAALATLTTLWATTFASAVNLIQPGGQRDYHEEATLTGKPISSYLPDEKVTHKTVVLVAIKGCGSCQSAEHDLYAAGVDFDKVNFCGLIRTQGCFDIDSQVTAPLLLVLDKHGSITYQHSGWANSKEGAKDFIRNLKLRVSAGKS